MWQLFIVTFFDWWEIQFDQVWSSLINFGQIWSQKIKNKTAIFILFKNVTTFYINIFWYLQPLRFFFRTDRTMDGQTDGQTEPWKPHRHLSSNSSLDMRFLVSFYFECQTWYSNIQAFKLFSLISIRIEKRYQNNISDSYWTWFLHYSFATVPGEQW